ncbi:chemokine-like factor [Pezoporus occidentalis]|uniref:chemokine-like factor n=1 Tax=Pezoporus occidentalis TaxID=407982 RepID=UPI002F90689F
MPLAGPGTAPAQPLPAAARSLPPPGERRGGAGSGRIPVPSGGVRVLWGAAVMALVEVDRAFPRSLRGSINIARMLLAWGMFFCFLGARSGGMYTSLAGMEVVITTLFFLLYLLKLDKKMTWLFWPLADIFNSMIAALFLLVVCLFAVVGKTNKATLAGGVFGFILLILCVVDAVVFWKISFGGRRERNAPAK